MRTLDELKRDLAAFVFAGTDREERFSLETEERELLASDLARNARDVMDLSSGPMPAGGAE